ncbi:complex I intermediate-associated protein 30 [Apiospora arundinis]
MSATFYPLPNTPPGHSHHPPSEIELRNIPSEPSISSSIYDSESTDEYGTHFQDPVHTTSGPDPSQSQAEVCTGGIASRPEDNDEIESLTEPRAQYHVFRYWKWELVSMAVAIGLLVAIIVLISQYHNRSINEWTFPINLTTLLALIATIFRTIILIPITSVISQSKWDWVGRDQVRLLSDIQDIDMASRGPWGAISILPLAAKGNIPALVAAITSILTLATAPFVQQAVITVECERTTQGVAAVPYAHFVPRSGGYSNPAGSPVPGEGSVTSAYDTELMVQSCQAGPDAPDNQIRPSCATGNCTFSDGDPTEDGDASHSTIAMWYPNGRHDT